MVQEVAGIKREGRDKGPRKETRIGTRKDEENYRDGDETTLEERGWHLGRDRTGHKQGWGTQWEHSQHQSCPRAADP